MRTRTRISTVATALILTVGALTWGGGAHQSAAKQFRVAISNQGIGYPYPAAIGKGMTDEAKKLGIKVIAQLDAKLDPQKQANDITDLITQKPDAIIVIPVNSAEVAKSIDQIAAAHIVAVSVHGVVGAASIKNPHHVYPKLTFMVDEDEIGAGREAARLAVKALPSGGQIGVVLGAAGFSEDELRMRDFKTVLAKHSAFHIVSQQPGDWTLEKGQAACQNELSSSPNIALFYAESDDMSVGCSKAVQSAGSKAKVIGVGGSKLGIRAIRSGQQYGTICYKPYTEGVLAMQALYRQLTGKVHYQHKAIFYNTPAITKANLGQCTPQW